MNIKIRSIMALILIVIMSIFPVMHLPSSGSEGKVSRSSTFYVGVDLDFSTIQEAIDNSTIGENQTIFVSPGVYNENIVIDKDVKLVGAIPDLPIIKGNGKGHVISINTSYCSIERLNISGIASQMDDPLSYNWSGIHFNNNSEPGTEIKECKIKNHSLAGIDLRNGDGVTIEKCDISAYRFGINIQQSKNITIDTSIITGNTSGIRIIDGSLNSIRNSIIYSGQNSIEINNSIKNKIVNSTIEGSKGIGISISNGSDRNNIMRNNIKDCNGLGIRIVSSDGNRIIGNNFYSNNDGGVQAEAGSINYWGYWGLIELGNYWNDYAKRYSSANALPNGTFDIPYECGNSKDRYPLVSPHTTNYPPVFRGVKREEVNVGGTIFDSYGNQFIDADTPLDDLEWTFSTNSTWLQLLNPPFYDLCGNPKPSDVGDWWVNITVEDEKSQLFINFTITVLPGDPAPLRIIYNESSDMNYCFEDSHYFMDFDASWDEAITWSLTTNASFLQIDQATGVINGIPVNDDVGSYFVNVSVASGEALRYLNYTLIVWNVNDPPRITTSILPDAKALNAYLFLVMAHDIDPTNNTLVWSLTTNCSFLVIDNSTGLLSGTPTISQVGTYWVNISVQDGNGGTDSAILQFEVIKGIMVEDIEDLDIGIDLGDEEIFEGRNQTFSLNTSLLNDLDLEDLNFTWFLDENQIAGYGLSILLNLSAGEYNLTLRITDAKGEWINISRQVMVKETDAGVDPDHDLNLGILIFIILIIVLVVSIVISFVIFKRKIRGRISDNTIEDHMGTPGAINIRSPDGPPSYPNNEIEVKFGLLELEGTGRMRYRNVHMTSISELDCDPEILEDMNFKDEKYLRVLENRALSFKELDMEKNAKRKLRRNLRKKYENGIIDRRIFLSALSVLDGSEE